MTSSPIVILSNNVNFKSSRNCGIHFSFGNDKLYWGYTFIDQVVGRQRESLWRNKNSDERSILKTSEVGIQIYFSDIVQYNPLTQRVEKIEKKENMFSDENNPLIHAIYSQTGEKLYSYNL